MIALYLIFWSSVLFIHLAWTAATDLESHLKNGTDSAFW